MALSTPSSYSYLHLTITLRIIFQREHYDYWFFPCFPSANRRVTILWIQMTVTPSTRVHGHSGAGTRVLAAECKSSGSIRSRAAPEVSQSVISSSRDTTSSDRVRTAPQEPEPEPEPVAVLIRCIGSSYVNTTIKVKHWKLSPVSPAPIMLGLLHSRLVPINGRLLC